MKIFFAIVYAAIVVLLGAATIVGEFFGTDFAREECYGAPWMIFLWSILALLGLRLLLLSGVRRRSLILLHVSFAIILLGALLTHLSGVQGSIHLRKGSFACRFVPASSSAGGGGQTLPFAVRLDDFRVEQHPGNGNAADFISSITIADISSHEVILQEEVAMNKIAVCRHWRFYQWSYDDDGMGATLIVNHDPWGISVTYCGYLLLFLTISWEAFRGCRHTFRRRRSEGRFTPFERTILFMASSLTTLILLFAAWFFITQMRQTNPWLPDMQPVLNSPFLSLHVAIVSIAYLLLLLAFVVSIPGMVTGRYLLLSRLLLYPSVACLAIGIFTGAIWANLSWGEYWSWDPKETWALVSMMVYAVALHERSIPWLRHARNYHVFIALSFLVLLMTCFGVNMLLSGLHSYA